MHNGPPGGTAVTNNNGPAHGTEVMKKTFDDNVRGEAQHHSAGDDRQEQREHGLQEQQVLHRVDGDQKSGFLTQDEPKIKRKDFRIIKKRGIIPDGLVQSRLDSFLAAFPNLRGGAR